MSGHSKWSTIKRQKGTADVKRGLLFSKLSRAITLAAREGTEVEANSKLRLVVEKAKQANMPKDNIEKAIKRAQGKLGGNKLEEVVFEGYGPGGVAVMIQTATDNRQRTASEVKHLLESAGGSLGAKGCVSYLFEPKGVMTVKFKEDPQEVMLMAIDFGAQDVAKVGERVVVYSRPEELEKIKEKLIKQGFEVEESEINLEPKTTVKITEPDKAVKILSLVDKLEELEDTQKVYASFDIPATILEKIG